MKYNTDHLEHFSAWLAPDFKEKTLCWVWLWNFPFRDKVFRSNPAGLISALHALTAMLLYIKLIKWEPSHFTLSCPLYLPQRSMEPQPISVCGRSQYQRVWRRMFKKTKGSYVLIYIFAWVLREPLGETLGMGENENALKLQQKRRQSKRGGIRTERRWGQEGDAMRRWKESDWWGGDRRKVEGRRRRRGPTRERMNPAWTHFEAWSSDRQSETSSVSLPQCLTVTNNLR